MALLGDWPILARNMPAHGDAGIAGEGWMCRSRRPARVRRGENIEVGRTNDEAARQRRGVVGIPLVLAVVGGLHVANEADRRLHVPEVRRALRAKGLERSLRLSGRWGDPAAVLCALGDLGRAGAEESDGARVGEYGLVRGV